MINKICLFSAPRHHVCSAISAISNRSYSQDVRTISNVDIASLKRGTGGRSSFSGDVVTIFGATGFLGKYICNQLGKRGAQLIIPYRGDSDDYALKKLKLVGDLGQVLFQPFNLKDMISIRKAVKYSNVVINLIGSYFDTKNFTMKDVNFIGAMNIAKACRDAGVERLIHFSSLNLTKHPQKYYMMKSEFLPTKLEGENAVLEEFPCATIMRPSIVYGHCDRFLWPLCSTVRSSFQSIPLYFKGKKTIRQPIFAHDIATAVIKMMNDNDSRGKIYQAVGPERFYLHDIATFCGQMLQRKLFSSNESFVHHIHLDPLFIMKVMYFRYGVGAFFYKPRMGLCFEQIEMESVTDVVDHSLPTLDDLDVSLSKMEEKIPHLIITTFVNLPNKWREYEEYIPADSLSAKAINEYV